MKLESILQYLDETLSVHEHPDYPNALNGLQVQGGAEVHRVAAAVDTSVETIEAAAAWGADLLLVHHGLFWGGLVPVTGRHHRRLSTLIKGGVSLYSAHLPLDAHPDFGNCALLLDRLGLERSGRFGSYQGVEIGWEGRVEGGLSLEELTRRAEEVLPGPVQVLPGGPPRLTRVGILTGGGGSFIAEAASSGLDALVTGEGSHHSYVDAIELGVNVLFGGHYATETFGVRALTEHLAERFDLDWTFLDFPSGL